MHTEATRRLTGAAPGSIDGRFASAEERDRLRLLRREQCRMLNKQACTAPFAIFAASLVVAYIIWKEAGVTTAWFWAVAVNVLPFARRAWVISGLSAERVESEPKRVLDTHVVFMLGSGFVTASATPLFFNDLTVHGEALLTMVMVCWSAGAVATTGVYAPAFMVFAIPVLLILSGHWLVYGFLEKTDLEHAVIGVLILLFGWILLGFARSYQNLVRDSIAYRLEIDAAHKATSEFLAHASHDLRHPVQILLNNATRLSEADGIEHVRHRVEGILECALSLASLFGSILELYKLEAEPGESARQRFDIKKLIEEIEAEQRPVARQKGIEFTASPVSAAVLTDPIKLGRLVRNLVNNAIKFTDHGRVTLAAERTEGEIRIVVRDTGPGIPEDKHEAIFQRFYQLHNAQRDGTKGFGLGLAIVRQIADQLGILVDVESTLGQGTAFIVRLPRLPDNETCHSAPVPREQRSELLLEGRHILLLENDRRLRESYVDVMSAWRCRVTAAASLSEVRSLLEASENPVSVIVADFHLDSGCNGVDSIRALREREDMRDVPALIVSGDTSSATQAIVRAAGMKFLYKGVPPAQFKEEVAQVLL